MPYRLAYMQADGDVFSVEVPFHILCQVGQINKYKIITFCYIYLAHEECMSILFSHPAWGSNLVNCALFNSGLRSECPAWPNSGQEEHIHWDPLLDGTRSHCLWWEPRCHVWFQGMVSSVWGEAVSEALSSFARGNSHRHLCLWFVWHKGRARRQYLD